MQQRVLSFVLSKQASSQSLIIKYLMKQQTIYLRHHLQAEFPEINVRNNLSFLMVYCVECEHL